jgi:hypothetical protein
MNPNGGRGFYDPQSEVNRLFDEVFGNVGRTSGRQQDTHPMRLALRSTFCTRRETCSSGRSFRASSAKTWR